MKKQNVSNKVEGFSKLSKLEKIRWVNKTYFNENKNSYNLLKQYWIEDEELQKIHDEFSENTLSNFVFPLGLAPNFLIDEKIDTGAVLLQQKMAIDSGETTGTLSERMQEKSGSMLIDTLDTLANSKFTPMAQSNGSSLKPAPKLTRINTRINWNEAGQDIVNKIHGLNPFPTAWSNLISGEDESYVKLKRAHFVKGTRFNLPGTIHIEDKQLGVAVPDGCVYIDELQLPNKKSMETAALLNGYVFPSKSRFE